jgi:HAD superfamily 5'-nucleotidase-like hydrolase
MHTDPPTPRVASAEAGPLAVPGPALEPADPPPGRGIYTNRTLNLRTVRAIGYDMDYTLVHYDPRAWEEAAYRHLQQKLADQGWPVAELAFDPDAIIRGLIIDRDEGNIVKANRFGYVKQAAHGTRMLAFAAQRETYARTAVDLSGRRFTFLNTLFSLSEAVMYGQLVDLLDAGALPGALDYAAVHDQVLAGLNAAHIEGHLKADIVADPERFVVLDPELPLALLDQHRAGKRLVLITNSEWSYTRFMMAYAFDRFLPAGSTWRDLFHLVIVAARKPSFFTGDAPLLHVVDEAGRLSPDLPAERQGQVFFGGNARQVEALLGLAGADTLYVGDHIYSDVHISKSMRRWRTALVLRELEDEIAAERAFRPLRAELEALMAEKETLERRFNQLRLAHQRRRGGYAPPPPPGTPADLAAAMAALRAELTALDERIGPLARAGAELHNGRWGLLLRTGNDKSYLTRQIERHADIYMSRVANFLYATPYAYLRSPRGRLPHDED